MARCRFFRFSLFKSQLKSVDYYVLSSKDFGLPLGVRAIAIKKKHLQKISPIYTGGGMIKHVTTNYVVWADVPERFEAGTPNIVSIIGFARALQLIKTKDRNLFKIKSKGAKLSKELFYSDRILDNSGEKLFNELKKLLIGYHNLVPTLNGLKTFINLDNAASTRTFLPIWDKYFEVFKQPFDSYGSIIQEVKDICTKFLKAPSREYDVIFTYNTTEAINIVAQSLINKSKQSNKIVILNTAMEHHSNELPFRYVKGTKLIKVSVDDDGFINLMELERILIEYNQTYNHGNDKIQLVAISAISNVLGAVNDLQSISQIVHKYGAKLIVDGAQLVAHHKINIKDNNIDYFVFSGHKMYAPFGSGVLVVKRGLLSFDAKKLKQIKSSGEENVAGVAALGMAMILLEKIGIDLIKNHEKKLIKLSLDGLNELSNIIIFGIQSSKSVNFNKKGSIISFNLREVPHNLAAKELAEIGGIGIRDGCFCAHILIQQILKLQKIRVIGARMTSVIIPEKTSMCLPGTLRISFGIENDSTDVRTLLQIIEKIMQKPRSLINKLLGYTNNGTLFLPKTYIEQKIKGFVEKTINTIF
ncbi:MAG: aminotransferase class V-fold PLP-dependent enzyme [Promethearchaeota archaeon]